MTTHNNARMPLRTWTAACLRSFGILGLCGIITVGCQKHTFSKSSTTSPIQTASANNYTPLKAHQRYFFIPFTSHTQGNLQGLHVDNIVAVVDYGLPQKKLTGIQRAGRCGRRGQMSVYLVMAECWAYTSSLDSVDPESTDPDRPISGRLTKHSRKPARAGLAMVLYVRSKVCLRDLIRRYLGDESREGKCIIQGSNPSDMSDLALDISYEWCCDLDHPNYPGRKFDKRSFFPGRFIYAGAEGAIYAGDVDEANRVRLNPPKGKKRKAKGLANRRVIDRSDLQCRLHTWLASAHASDPLRAVRPATFILDPKAIKALSTVHPDRIISVSQVVMTVQETAEWGVEWGADVLAIISAYDAELNPNSNEQAATRKGKKSSQVGGRKDKGGEDDYEPVAKKSRPLAEVSTNIRRSSRLAGK